MILSAIVAISENNVIGNKQGLIWHLPNDLKHFKNKTKGHCVIMGRKTFESIGKPLPNRINIIITRQKSYVQNGCKVVNSLEEAILYANQLNEEEAFIIGGAEIYKQAFSFLEKLYLTIVLEKFEGDTSFPEYDKSKWKLISEDYVKKDEKNPYDHIFQEFIRIK